MPCSRRCRRFPFNNIDHFSTASLITRLTNDVNNLQITLMMSLRILLRAPMMLVIAFFLAYSINAELSIVLAIAIPLLVVGILADHEDGDPALCHRAGEDRRAQQHPAGEPDRHAGGQVVRARRFRDPEVQEVQRRPDQRRHPGGQHRHPEHAADDAGDERRHPGHHLVGRADGLRRHAGRGRADQLSQLRLPDPDERDDDLDGHHDERPRPGQREAGGGGAGYRDGYRSTAAQPAPADRWPPVTAGQSRVPGRLLQVQPERQRRKCAVGYQLHRPAGAGDRPSSAAPAPANPRWST